MSYPPTPPLQPIPVQPLGYVLPTYQRPGVLTAVGVLSIVVASVTLLVGSITGLYGVGLGIASASMSRMSARTTVAPPAPTPPPMSADETEGDGMSVGERKTVVAALAGMRGLPEVRQKHLGALLAEAGRKVLPLRGEALTRGAVVANCTDAGRLPSGGKSAGADYFVFGRGRVEVDDRHAVFYPSGAGEVVRASAEEGETVEEETDAATTQPAAVGGGLSAQQVRQVIAAVESRTKMKLNPAQVQALRGVLTAPGQTFFTPGTGVAGQIISASASSGTVTLSTNTGFVSVTSSGGVNSMNFSMGTTKFPNVWRPAVMVMVFSGLSLALAAWLLVAAIFVIRNSPRGRGLHLVYAWLEIPVAIGLGAGLWWLWDAFINGMAAMGGGGGTSGGMGVRMFVLAIPVLPGLVYAVVLLGVLNTRGVKEYYNMVR